MHRITGWRRSHIRTWMFHVLLTVDVSTWWEERWWVGGGFRRQGGSVPGGWPSWAWRASLRAGALGPGSWPVTSLALVGTQPDDDLMPGSTLTDHRGGEWAVTRSSAPAADIVASLQARIS